MEESYLSNKQENWEHARIDWDLHVKKLLHETHFSTEYRMGYDDFNQHCSILSPFLERQHSKSRAKERILKCNNIIIREKVIEKVKITDHSSSPLSLLLLSSGLFNRRRQEPTIEQKKGHTGPVLATNKQARNWCIDIVLISTVWLVSVIHINQAQVDYCV